MDDSYECPAIVVYIVNPFSYAAQDWDDLNRLAIIGLLRCYKEVISMLPENMKNNIYLQVSTFFLKKKAFKSAQLINCLFPSQNICCGSSKELPVSF